VIGLRSRRPSSAAAAATCGVAVLVAIALLPPVAILDRPTAARGDVHHYESIAKRLESGAIPYRDFHFEYPPLALVPIAVPALADDYQDAFRLLMLAIAGAGIALVAHLVARLGGGRWRLFVACVGIGLAPLALPVVFFDRLDAWPVVLLLAGMSALVAGRHTLAAGVLAAGTLAKIFPVVGLPAVALDDRRGRRIHFRDLAVFAGVTGGVLVAFVLVSFSGTAHTASTLVRRPLHIESLGGSALLSLHQLGLYEPTVYVSFGGSQDLAGPLAAAIASLQGVTTAVALVLTWLLFARGERSVERALTATAASVVALVAFGKVLSPQFLVWIVFVVPLVERRLFARAVVLTVAALVLTRAYYPYRYEELILLGDVAWVMLTRNVVLAALALFLISSLRRPADRAELNADPAPSVATRATDRG
jgi:Glycosyltransferase family 87